MHLGKMNRLQAARWSDYGLFLHGGPDGTILLPRALAPTDAQPGDWLDVFLYLDQEERITATTETPLAQVGDFAWLRVAWVNSFGAFLDWGLQKDLFVPFREQKMKMQIGQNYLVHVHIDPETCRIMASAKVERYLSRTRPPFQPRESVSVLVWQKTDLGFKVIVENRFQGLLYDDEIFRDIHSGDRLTAYVRQVRPDGKIDLTLQRTGRSGIRDFRHVLLDYLCQHGSCPLGDKSTPENIRDTFGVSKKVFKQAVGDLYKHHRIIITPEGLQLVK